MRLRPVVAAALLLAGAAVSGCGSGNMSHSSSSEPGAPTSAAPTSSAYVVLPSGTQTTAPGTTLHVGDAATVGWKAPKAGTTGVLGITVTALKRTSFAKSFVGWRQTPKLLSTRPYFVEATVKNSGKTDLAGFAAPLYGLDKAGQLVEASTFAQPFAPCRPDTFPTKHFRPGETTHVCLVYLVPNHGNLVGVVYRPDESLSAITWTGPIEALKATKG